ncbi:MAG: tetratricopeptide repeat protein [Planctomycetaceae bacterium]
MRPFFVWPLTALGISIIVGCGGSSSESVSPASSGQEQSGDAQSKITESSGLEDPSETKAQQARNAVSAGAQTGDEKNYAEAIRYYTEAIGQSPDDAELYQERGLIHALLEQHESAIKDLTQAIDRNRTEASLYRWRAEEYFESGDFDSAERDIENAIALKPENSEFYVVRASLRAELGRVDEALADYQHAIDLDDRAFHYYLRGTLQAALDSPDAALEDLTTAINKEPDQADYYLAPARTCRSAWGSRNRHWQTTERPSRCDPNNANTLQRRAGFLLSQGENDAAIADLTAALEREPGLLTATAAWDRLSNGRAIHRGSC